jgi:formamidopyrimidine-DNA glycosylase
MSIELPEARILATQLDQTMKGKTIQLYDLMDVERMTRIGFINKNIFEFDDLIGKTVEAATSRGNVIRIKLSEAVNLLLAPEYGGVVTFLPEGGKVPKYHLRIDFTDGSKLTIRITSMGLIYAVRDEKLTDSYMYKRDFMNGVSPIEPDYTWEWFRETFEGQNRQSKLLIVGKEAHMIGISNATFQDVLYRAGVHPKRKVSDLSENQLRGLYDNINLVMDERVRLNGKHQFKDIYVKTGSYVPPMGPNMKDRHCPNCGTLIKKLAHGGGHVYLCPTCQPE